MGGNRGPFRTHDEAGRQIVRVAFFPGAYKCYAYVAAPGLTLKPGDLVWAPANDYSPEPQQVRVRALGSEYAGDMAEIKDRVAKDETDTSAWPVVTVRETGTGVGGSD